MAIDVSIYGCSTHGLSDRRARYAPALLAMLPGCPSDELNIRCSICWLRDHVTFLLKGSSIEAAAPLEIIQRIATVYATASMKLQDLEDLRNQLIQLLLIAQNFERLLAPARGRKSCD